MLSGPQICLALGSLRTAAAVVWLVIWGVIHISTSTAVAPWLSISPRSAASMIAARLSLCLAYPSTVFRSTAAATTAVGPRTSSGSLKSNETATCPEVRKQPASGSAIASAASAALRMGCLPSGHSQELVGDTDIEIDEFTRGVAGRDDVQFAAGMNRNA